MIQEQSISRIEKSKPEKPRFSELAGGMTAGCAALCCCPCAVFGFVSLAVVKLPAGLCRKAIKKVNLRRARKLKHQQHTKLNKNEDQSLRISVASINEPLTDKNCRSSMSGRKTSLSNEEFWDEVTGKKYVGFWRNLSYKEETTV